MKSIVQKATALLDPFIGIMLLTVAIGLSLPPVGPFARIFGGIADAGIALLFFLHGAKLSRTAITDGARNWRLHAATLAITYLLFPAMGVTIVSAGWLDASLGDGVLFLTLLPSTVQSSIAFTAMARGNVAAAVCSASLSNLMGIVLTPLWVAILLGGHGGTPWGEAVLGIFLQLLLPFLLGHASRRWTASFITRHKRLLTVVDRGSILLVIYCAVGAAAIDGLWAKTTPSSLLALAAINMALLVIVLVASDQIGVMLRMPREDRIVLQFCGSKKSLASGVPMAGLLFPSAQAGLMILPLVLFHQIQLIVCAILARRYAESAATGCGQAA